MASFVDLNNKKIVGCEKNSLTWFHEKGHLIYNNSLFGMKNDYIKETMYSLFFSNLLIHITSNFFNLNRLFSAFFLTLAWLSGLYIVYLFLFEEIWCWKYAIKKRNIYKGENVYTNVKDGRSY